MKRSKGHERPLEGKVICFSGAITGLVRKEATEIALSLGASRVADDVSRKVDILFVGDSPGSKVGHAKDVGCKVESEDVFLAMVAAFKGGSSSDDIPHKRRFVLDDEQKEDETSVVSIPSHILPPLSSSSSSSTTKKPKCKYGKGCYRTNPQHLQEFSHSDSEEETKTKSKKPKCPYGKDCYRTNIQHRIEFSHSDDESQQVEEKTKPKPKDSVVIEAAAAPSSPPKPIITEEKDDEATLQIQKENGDNDDDESTLPITNDDPIEPPIQTAKQSTTTNSSDEKDEFAGLPKPIHQMKTGETHDVDGKYIIKRCGNHFYCTCPAWRNQTSAVDNRTCKHLREYLGSEFEEKRCSKALSAPQLPKKPAPPLLLANKWDLENGCDPTGWWMSEKLDGVRCFWDGKVMVSRLGNEFPAPGFFISGLPTTMTLDGELWEGRGNFQTAVSTAKTNDVERWRNLVYEVFDAPSLGEKPFEERMSTINEYFRTHPIPHVRVVKQVLCRGKDHLLQELHKVESLGGEGLMIRQAKSKYVGSRSSTLLKIKTFHDADAKVIGHEPGKGKYAGMIGSLQCEMLCGKKFKVGSGMSDSERKTPPPIGSIITYKFQELTEDGIPRFPTFVCVRIDAIAPSDPPPKKHPSEDD